MSMFRENSADITTPVHGQPQPRGSPAASSGEDNFRMMGASTIRKAQFEPSTYQQPSSYLAAPGLAQPRTPGSAAGSAGLSQPRAVGSPSINMTASHSRVSADTSAFNDIKQENTNLKLRLVYLDEVMSKRGFNTDAIETEVGLRITLEQLGKTQQHLEEQVNSLTTQLALEEQANVQLRHDVEDTSRQLQQEVETTRGLQGRNSTITEQIQTLEEVHNTTQQQLLELRQTHNEAMVLSQGKERELVDLVAKREVELGELHAKVVAVEQTIPKLQAQAELRWNEEMLALRDRENQLKLNHEADLLQLQQKLEMKTVELEAHERDARELVEVIQEKDKRIRVKLDEQGLLEDEITLLKDKVAKGGLELDQQAAKARVQLAEKDEQFFGEQHRFAELAKAAEAQDEVLAVYKYQFHLLVDRVKQLGTQQLVDGVAHSALHHSPPHDHEDRHVHFNPTLSAAGHLSVTSHLNASPLRPPGPSNVDSVAVRKITEVLTAATEDLLTHLKEVFHSKKEDEGRALQRAGHLTLMSMEENYSRVCTRIRKVSMRIVEACDSTRVVARKAGRKLQLNKESSTVLTKRCASLQQEQDSVERVLRQRTEENHKLRHEVQAAAAAQEKLNAVALTQDLMAKSRELARECTGEIESHIKLAVKEIRKVFVDTNILTQEFCDNIQRVSSKAGNALGKSGGASNSEEAESKEALKMISEQLSNIAALLSTNLKQGGQNRERLEGILAVWEKDLLSELQVFEARYHQLAQSKSAKMGGSRVPQQAVSPYSFTQVQSGTWSDASPRSSGQTRRGEQHFTQSVMKVSPLKLEGPASHAVDEKLRAGSQNEEEDEIASLTLSSLKPYGSMRRLKPAIG